MSTRLQRPAYRYLTPLPEPEYGRLQRGIRWGLLFALALWVVIFAAGFLVART